MWEGRAVPRETSLAAERDSPHNPAAFLQLQSFPKLANSSTQAPLRTAHSQQAGSCAAAALRQQLHPWLPPPLEQWLTEAASRHVHSSANPVTMLP